MEAEGRRGESGSRGKVIGKRRGGRGEGGEGTSLQQEVHRASTTKLKCMRCPPVTHEGNDPVCLLTALKLQL